MINNIRFKIIGNWLLPEKLTKFPNFTRFCPKNARLYSPARGQAEARGSRTRPNLWGQGQDFGLEATLASRTYHCKQAIASRSNLFGTAARILVLSSLRKLQSKGQGWRPQGWEWVPLLGEGQSDAKWLSRLIVWAHCSSDNLMLFIFLCKKNDLHKYIPVHAVSNINTTPNVYIITAHKNTSQQFLTFTLCSEKKHPLTFSFISPWIICGFKQKLLWIYPRIDRFWQCKN